MQICILLQSRHEICPFFLHNADRRRGRLSRGVGDAGTGRSSCRRATNHNEKIFGLQIKGREADNDELGNPSKIVGGTKGSCRHCPTFSRGGVAPKMVSGVYAGPVSLGQSEFENRKGRKKICLCFQAFLPARPKPRSAFLFEYQSHFKLL